MHGADHVRVVGVILAAVNELEQAALLDRLALVPGLFAQQFLVGLEIAEANTLDAIGRPGETEIDNLLMQAHRFEQLGAAIAGDGGDAHLGGDLVQTLVDALAVIGIQFRGIFRSNLAGALHIAQAGIGQIGIDCGGAVADQHGKVMWIPGGTGFHHQVGIAAQAFPDQPVVHCTGGKQGMHRTLVPGDITIAQYQHYLALLDGADRLVANIHDR